MSIEPFHIQISEQQLDDLRNRLGATRWPDTLDATSGESGLGLSYAKELIDFWKNQYDWRAAEEQLNAFSHYRINLDGMRIHFLHEKGKGDRRLPLLLIHGWPGSFWEMHKVIPFLQQQESFDLIIPSLPGYGFSDRPTSRGMNSRKIADLFARLMRELGYTRCVAQGGDWGAGVATWLALDHPEQVQALHLNYIPGSYRPHFEEAQLTAAEKEFLVSAEEWYRTDGGYGHLQATRPQTAAFALNDSPAGLAAWIVEKFRDWSDCGGDVEKRFTKEELLTNVSIYWFTQTIHSSMRLYREAAAMPLRLQSGQKIEVPCAVARFPLEAPMPPLEWVKRGYNVVRWTEMRSGGHFAALEEPDALAADICSFLGSS